MNNKGFTLVELILVISIIGILAVTAIPKFYDLTASAQQAAEDGIVAAVRAGINNAYMNNLAAGNDSFPANLDGNATAACATCFDTVLKNGISDGWSRAGQVYTAPDTTTYTYTPANGTFQ